MSIAKEYEMRTLRLSNVSNHSLLRSSVFGKFEAIIPENMRNKPCIVTVQGGFVTNLDNIYPAGVDTHVCFIRSNLTTDSYDVTTKGGNLMLGSVVRPVGTEKSGTITDSGVANLGSCILPPVITVEVLGVVTATGVFTGLSNAASYIEVTLGLEFEK
tara:strand:+ start:164 stop:637 length:474 start_codon:yes stop_codon:yes gene_type:complete